MKEFDFFKMLDLAPERAGLYLYCLHKNFCLRLRDEERLMQPQNLPLFKAYVADFSLSLQGERLMLEQKNADELIKAYLKAGNTLYYENKALCTTYQSPEDELVLKTTDDNLKPYIKISLKSTPSISASALELIAAKSDGKLFEIFCQQFPHQDKAKLEAVVKKCAAPQNQAEFLKICSKYL